MEFSIFLLKFFDIDKDIIFSINSFTIIFASFENLLNIIVGIFSVSAILNLVFILEFFFGLFIFLLIMNLFYL